MTLFKRLRLLALAAMALATLSGCASMIGPRDYDVPVARLQQSLDKRFPLQQRALAVLDLRLQHPQLSTLDNERVSLRADLDVSSLLMRQAFHGSLALSGRLQLDQARHAIVLSEARIDGFTVNDVDERVQGQISAAGSLVLDKLMRDVPIYTYQPQDLRYAGVQFVPVTIRTDAKGLHIRLEPAP
jgi:hypothetical protein